MRFLFIILLLGIQCSFGQIHFQNIYTLDSLPGIAYDITQTKDGGYAFTGYSYKTDNEEDVVVVKTDSVGNILWQQTYGGEGRDIGRSIVEDTAGNIFVTGYGNQYFGEDYDMILLKYDPNGNLLWHKLQYGSGDDHGWHIIVDKDSTNILVLGYTTSNGPGSGAMTLLQIDQDGNVLTEKSYGGDLRELGHFIEPLDSGYLIVGHGTSFSVEGAGGPTEDAILIKIDDDFNTEWGMSYGSDDREEGNAVTSLPNNEFAMAGVTSSYGFGKDIFVVKTDSLGNKIWSKIIGSNEDDDALDITSNNAGDIIVTGLTEGFTASRDVFILHLDSAGNTKSCKVINGYKNDTGYGIIHTNDNGVAVCGYAQSFSDVTSDIIISKYDSLITSNCHEISYDPFNFDVDITVTPGVLSSDLTWSYTDPSVTYETGELTMLPVCDIASSDDPILKEDLNTLVYPNPASKYFSININTDFEYYLTDELGRIVLHGNVEQGPNNQIDIHDFDDGLYFLNIHEENGEKRTVKLIIR